MNIFITIILTILIYELINFIAYVVSGEKENVIVITSTGIWYVIWGIIVAIGNKILLLNSRKYNLYRFYGEVSESKRDNKCDKCICSRYMTPKVASQFKLIDKEAIPSKDFCVQFVKSGKEFKSFPSKYEILTQKDIDNGIKGMDAEFLKKFKKED